MKVLEKSRIKEKKDVERNDAYEHFAAAPAAANAGAAPAIVTTALLHIPDAFTVDTATAAPRSRNQLTGTGYVGQLGLGGIQTAVNADKAASELYGNIIAATMAGASGNGEDGGGWLSQIRDVLPF